MNREQILSVLYDLSLTIGGELDVDSLLQKTLQRLLFHTSFPAGLVLAAPHSTDFGDAALLEKAVGDHQLIAMAGRRLNLPAGLLADKVGLLDDASLLHVFSLSEAYTHCLRLPIDDQRCILLLSPVEPAGTLPLIHVFQPILANLAKALLLCTNHQRLTSSLEADRDDARAELAIALAQSERERAFLDSLYETIDPDFVWQLPENEWDAIALNYTSGTTGNPKGVVYHHRGAYLNSASNIISWGMQPHSVYLWTLPMFHCNGWCFPWTLAANTGTSVCLRKVDPALIFGLIKAHKVTHMCGAPIVYGMMINAPAALKEGIEHQVNGLIAGAAPPAAIIEGCEKMGFNITHVYGLTETYGPASVCAKHPEWDKLPIDLRAARNGRQGVRYHMQEAIAVLDPVSMEAVPWDGETMGEIMFRGNLVMKGYLKNPKATEEAFAGGWFHTGDLAVVHSDGYVKIKDRSKDIIISGGENISSLEVEDVLYRHPAVIAAAVVAKPDEKWGEVPAAFIELKSDVSCTEAEIIEHCRAHLARFKVPKQVVFGELPKTSTGKIQKYVLRQHANSALAIE